jgi:predicted glutamine amidotransferase
MSLKVLVLRNKMLPFLILLFLFPFAAFSLDEKCFNPETNCPHECRFWAMIAPSLPSSIVMEHLVNGSSSLKVLGATNYNGWGLAYYNDTKSTVYRGEQSASSDPAFELAARELAESGSHIGVGHVRLATSGARNIPNPHPFIRLKNGRWWAFGHNGHLSIYVLKELIGEEYLNQNPPTVGDNWSDPRIVDSDLYMLYILKCTEENGWNATEGIAKAVGEITKKTSGAMNFFLTDGETLWGFRLGYTLYYCHNETPSQYSAIASQPPTSNTKNWKILQDYNLITLKTNHPPTIIENLTTIPETTNPTILLPLLLTLTLAIVATCKKKHLHGPGRI